MAYEFAPGADLKWEHAVWYIYDVSTDDDGTTYFSLINVENNARTIATEQDLLAAWAAGELSFVIHTREGDRVDEDPKYPEERDLALSDYPEDQQALAKYRLMVIKPLLDVESSQRSNAALRDRVTEIQIWQKEHNEDYPISTRSIQRWLRHYTRSGRDIRSLLDNHAVCGGPGNSRLDPDAEALMLEVVNDEALKKHPEILSGIHQILASKIAHANESRSSADHLSLPSESTLWRRIKAISVEDRLESQQGKEASRKVLAQAGKTPYPKGIYEQVEMDTTQIPVLVIDELDNLPLGYPWLVTCFDRASRYPLGRFIGFEPPSYLSVMLALYHAIRPKAYVGELYQHVEHKWSARGIPAELIVDNGREYIGNDLREACVDLGITLTQAPVGNPAFKAGVERYFLTNKSDLFRTLPGRKLRYWGFQQPDSVQTACLSLYDLDEIFHIYTLDIYAENYHSGLQDIPARVWERGLANGFVPRMPPSAKALWIQLCRTAWRDLHHYGVQLFNLRYNCRELGSLRLERDSKYRHTTAPKLKIKWAPSDLSKIYVLNEFAPPGSDTHYIEVPAVDQDYTRRMSYWKHRVILREARKVEKSVDLAALGRARLRIRAIIEDARTRKSSQKRNKIARYDNMNVFADPSMKADSGEPGSPDEALPSRPPRSSTRISALMLEGEENDNHTIDEAA
jgi:putative transposase